MLTCLVPKAPSEVFFCALILGVAATFAFLELFSELTRDFFGVDICVGSFALNFWPPYRPSVP